MLYDIRQTLTYNLWNNKNYITKTCTHIVHNRYEYNCKTIKQKT